MFRTPRDYRTFLTVLLTYTLDLVGFSIVFPVLAPLLLNANLGFFSPDTTEVTRTTVLGILFSFFGIAQFFGSPIVGALADHYGRYKLFLGTVGLSILGYAVMAISVYNQSLYLLFLGRIITGLCSGNVGLAQSTTADLTEPRHRSKAFGILLGVGGLGFVAGPWVGGKLANPDWLYGSGAFIFAAIAAIANFLMLIFFFKETWKPKEEHIGHGLGKTFKDLHQVFHLKPLRIILITSLLFSIGWAFFLIFSPTFLVQRFSLTSDKIGDFFAYMAIMWTFASMFLNKELTSKFSLRSLILVSLIGITVGVTLFVFPETLWPYWIIIPIALIFGAITWVNLGAMLSLEASANMQGRAMGAGGAMWSIGQIVSPLLAGPLAGWNMHAPLLVGSVLFIIAFFYFMITYSQGKVPHPDKKCNL